MNKQKNAALLKWFSERKAIDIRKWWRYTPPIIQGEVRKALADEPHELVALAEYFASNVPGNTFDFDVHLFLRDTHGFIGDLEQSWNVALSCFPKQITDEFRFYRRSLKSLKIPSHVIFSRQPPRSSRHWSENDIRELNLILADSLAEFETDHSLPFCERYCVLEDRIFADLQQAASLSFEQFQKHRSGGVPDKMQVRYFRELSDSLAGLLSAEIEKHKDILRPDFESEEAYALAVRITLETCERRWRECAFWDRREFLHTHVYQVWSSLCAGRWDIRELYQEKHSLSAPMRLWMVEEAQQNRIARIRRDAENHLREINAIPLIGEGWLSQAALCALLKKAFPNEEILTEATPRWLGRMRLDVFFPRHNIAVEYQGAQHFEAVTLFGGEAGLVTTQKRDELKRQLCQENGCHLVEVLPDYSIEAVIAQVSSLILSKPTNPCHVDVRVAPIIRRSRGGASKSNKGNLAAMGAHDVRSCARHGTGDLIRTLARQGTDFAALQEKHEDSLLFVAASSGNIDTLRALLECGLDVNSENCRRTTVLARLCNHSAPSDLAIIRMILSAGADLTRCAWGYNIWASYGYAQPMIGAAAASNVPLSELLLEFGADVNSRHILSGFTPFLAACSHHARRHASSEARLAMLQWLISKEAEPFATNHLGQTAFDVAVDSMGVTPPDSALFYFLMEMKIPVHDMWLYRVKREYEITEEPELKVILDYAAGPGKPIRMRKTKSPAC